MGDASTPLPVGPYTTSPADPANVLRAQVNRFLGPSVPATLQLSPTQVPSTGAVDLPLATFAAVIYQRRATDAFAADPTQVAMVTRGNLALADPLNFVVGNMAEVTQTVQAYGDANGLPAAGSLVMGIPISTLAIAGCALLALHYLMNSGSR